MELHRQGACVYIMSVSCETTVLVKGLGVGHGGPGAAWDPMYPSREPGRPSQRVGPVPASCDVQLKCLGPLCYPLGRPGLNSGLLLCRHLGE